MYEGGYVNSTGATNERVRAADFGTSPIAAGLKGAADVIGDYAKHQEQLTEIHDEATVKESATSVAQYYSELGYTGPNAYYSKSGKDALLTRPMVERGLDSYIEQTKAGLKSDRQRILFDQALKPQRVSWGVQIAQHADKETKTYALDESQARLGSVGEIAKQSYIADPEHGEAQIATGLSEVEAQGRLQGWGEDRTALEKLKFSSGVYKDIGTRLAYEGGTDGPKLAEALTKVHGSSMTADDIEAVRTHARTQQNALEAEVRRQQNEERRIAREEKSDRHTNAESVYRNIQDGVVVDPQDMATAMGDAKFAGDDALVEGLRQGGLKNSLTHQWAGAAPAELQSRVNELSSEITKAGGKVKPDMIVERDHLQTLLGNSRTELNRDPLSWGAEHLGIKPTPLNLNDPASIGQRIQDATTIARRTGTLPRPLMQDEVAASQQILNRGTVQEKVGLALRLARLGPLALPAAEQLTSNPAYINIIGLATHENRGVAASRVNQVITGYDVLKTKPKLVDKTMAQQQFNEYLGSSLQFLPQVKAGALSNAQALLASEANEHGWSEWGEIENRAWFRAVNSALGSYTRDGKQVGGIARVNGAITVLPENMTQEEFEGRIAKSHGPEFRRAQNGVPVFADGRSPTATDLKRMQWVPSGDNVYRLSDGSGFLQRKDGGFYEIDVTKLNGLDAQLAAHGYVRH